MHGLVFLICSIFLFSSCTIVRWANTSPNSSGMVQESKVTKSNKDLWLGKSSEDLVLHPILATKAMDRRKASSDVEVITFKNSAGFQGKNEAGFFGTRHSTEAEVACSHVFYLRKDIIYDYQRVGSCTDEEDPSFAPIVLNKE